MPTPIFSPYLFRSLCMPLMHHFCGMCFLSGGFNYELSNIFTILDKIVGTCNVPPKSLWHWAQINSQNSTPHSAPVFFQQRWHSFVSSPIFKGRLQRSMRSLLGLEKEQVLGDSESEGAESRTSWGLAWLLIAGYPLGTKHSLGKWQCLLGIIWKIKFPEGAYFWKPGSSGSSLGDSVGGPAFTLLVM